MVGLATRGLDAEAFLTLYERYEGRIYNVCYRTLGYQDGAAAATRAAFLGMLRGAEAFAAVHTACHDLIEGPSVLPEARTRGIRVANLTLSVPQREVLALRELEGLSHDEVAEIMGIDGEAVEELICGARVRLRGSLCRPGPSTFRRADCERALPLIAREQDDALEADSNEAGWLAEHLMRCRTCRLGRDAMQEASETYRLWRPMTPGPKLLRETMESAADLAGADWSKAIARHEAQRDAILSHRLRDLAAIGVLACLLVLVALASVSLKQGRDVPRAPLHGAEAPAARDAARGDAGGDPPASGGPTAGGRTAGGRASRGPASRRPGSRGPASRQSDSRRPASRGLAPRAAPGARGERRRTAANRGAGPERVSQRRSERPLERRGSERAERRQPDRDRRPSAAPEPAPRRPQSGPQAQIERKPDPGGQENVLPELAPAPALSPSQP